MSESFITHISEGRFFVNGINRYELPRDSADLYLNSAKFQNIWGDDVFFVTGEAIEPTQRPEGSDFVITGDRDFLLSDKIAYNPKAPPQCTSAQAEARAAFKLYRDLHPNNFPTMGEIRAQEEFGKDLMLLSGGAMVFVVHDFGAGPETRIALLKRTFKPLVLTDGNGLVAEPCTSAKEALEELSPVVISADGKTCTVYAIDFTDPLLAERDYVAIKQSQKQKLLGNLAREGIVPTEIEWEKAGITEISVLPQYTITLYAPHGKAVMSIGELTGIIGEEYDHNTLVCRRAGIWNVPKGAMDLRIIDGEFERVGNLLSHNEFAEIAASGPSAILSSTASIGTYLFDRLPRPVNGITAKPEVIKSDGPV